MEKAFSIATAAGLPLQCSLSGVLAPGAKRGLKYSFFDVSVFFPFTKGYQFLFKYLLSVGLLV